MQKFGAFLRALFLDRPGQQWVERGDYDLTRDEDKQVICAEEWNTLITPGMVLRMSMILRDAEVCALEGRVPYMSQAKLD